MSGQRSIAGNAALTLVFQAISVLASVLMGIGTARVLGPAGRGAFAYVGAALGIVLTFAQGISNAVITQYKTEGLPSAVVYRAMLILLAWASLLLTIAVLCCAMWAPGQSTLFAVAIALPFALYVSGASGFLIADGCVQRTNVISAVTAVGTALIVLPALFFFHVSTTIVLGLWALGYVVASVLALAWTYSYARGEVSGSLLREIIGRQSRLAFSSCSVFLVGYLNTRIDLFIVAALRGPVALGWYSLAIAVGELLWRWSQALNWAAFSRIAGEDLERSAALAAQLTRTILLLQGIFVVVLFFAAPWLITTVYGERFLPSVGVLRMLLPGILAYSLEVSFGFFIMVRLKRPNVNLVIQACSTVVCAALTFLLLPRYGLIGAAFATSLTYTVVTIIVAVVFLRASGLPPSCVLFVRWKDITSLAHRPGVKRVG